MTGVAHGVSRAEVGTRGVGAPPDRAAPGQVAMGSRECQA